MSVSGGLFIVPLYTLLQERSRREVRSQIIAGNNIINAGFMVLSSVLLMLLYSLPIELSEVFLVFALLNLAMMTYVYWSAPEFIDRLMVYLRQLKHRP